MALIENAAGEMQAAKAKVIKNGMPHNIEAEQSVIACVLLDNDCLGVFSRLSESHFYSSAHKIIYEAIQSLIIKNIAVDFVTLTERLTATGKLDSVGGLPYLTALTDIVPTSANFKHYVAIVKKNAVLRRLVSAGTEIAKTGANSDDEHGAIQVAEKLVFDIGKEDEKKELTSLGQELPNVLETLDKISKDPEALRGLKTGFYALDDLTNGLQKSDLIIIAARPSVGKTSLALNIVLNSAIRYKTKCAIFSLEMSKTSLAMRALCSVAKVSLYKAMRGGVTNEEWSNLWNANKKLSQANIYVDDNSSITAGEIMRKCMRLKRERGLDLVMVDYLGLMGGNNTSNMRYENRQVLVAENSRAMKIMAKELDVPVMLLSQLNRGIETRRGTESEPVLSDLRESGAIEQDADIVMFIHKPKTEGGEEEQQEDKVNKSNDYEAKIILAKHRNGPTGSFQLHYHGEWTTFMNPNSRKEVVTPASAPKVNITLPEIVPIEDSSVSDVF
jgi:replicative DNA helicase